jgi:cytosine/adenosine deaminase-related metal-dependent hydrolase
MRRILFLSITTALLVVSASLSAQERAVAIRGGTVLPVSGPAIPNGTVVIRGGKVVAIGANVQVPAGAEIVDATGKYVMPGVVDAASYIGLSDNDLNEPTDPMTPQNRVWEAYNPFGTFGSGQAAPLRNKEALSGGVTTMYIAPADAQLLGGQGAV